MLNYMAREAEFLVFINLKYILLSLVYAVDLRGNLTLSIEIHFMLSANLKY